MEFLSYLISGISLGSIYAIIALGLFAWILNTNAEKSGLNVSITPQSASRGRGLGVMRRNSSRNGSTPKLVRAEPKNTGESLPARTSSRSNSRPAPSSSTSSISC